MASKRNIRIAIIGAGASGLMALIQLRACGYRDVVIFEKAAALGGTWRDNRYPGLNCDVPSHAYRFSFAPNAEWSQTCASGPDILAYLHTVARDHEVARFIRYNAEVISARYDDGLWYLATATQAEMPFEAVITATGVLHHPVYPQIVGLETFAGAAFHSARWPDDIAIGGQRIGVIGTGSTATQIVGATVDTAKSVTLFQRTAQWILPLANPEISEDERAQFRADPELLQGQYDRLNHEATTKFAAAIVGANPHTLATLGRLCREHLETVVDPVLREQLTPDYPVGCKRLVMSDRFYAAIQRPNAELVTAAIDGIEPEGVRTVGGVLHRLDILVLATGFNTHQFFRPMRVHGLAGADLDQVWAEENVSYLGVTTPALPNWFMIGGPHSPIGNFSWLLTAETQFGYIKQLLDLMRQGAKEIAAKPAAAAAFRAAVRDQVPKTVWAQGCNSWYIDKNGNVASWPWTYDKFKADMAAPVLADFSVRAWH